MKSSLSAYDLSHIISELQFLECSKIEKIFQQTESDEFIFSIHVPGKGKHFLFCSLPNLFCLTNFKPSFPDVPPHFCASLRRKITNGRITNISQQGFERILNIDISTKNGSSRLIIELLPPGNMILINTEDENKILAIRYPKIWNEDRKILPNKPYSYPPAQKNPKSFTKDDFLKELHSSDKESLVKFLAIDCSLGGFYAEEVMCSSSVDKNKSPKELSENEANEVFSNLQNLLNEKTAPIKSEVEIFPIVPKQDIGNYMSIDSFNEGVASVTLEQLEQKDHNQQHKAKKESLSKFEKIIKSQSQQLSGLDKSQLENQKKAEAIYNNYTELKELLATINELKKTKSWDEIKELYEDNTLVASIDEHKGIVYVDIK